MTNANICKVIAFLSFDQRGATILRARAHKEKRTITAISLGRKVKRSIVTITRNVSKFHWTSRKEKREIRWDTHGMPRESKSIVAEGGRRVVYPPQDDSRCVPAGAAPFHTHTRTRPGAGERTFSKMHLGARRWTRRRKGKKASERHSPDSRRGGEERAWLDPRGREKVAGCRLGTDSGPRA